MIKPVKITPLNTCDEIYFECSACGEKGTTKITMINTDNNGNPMEPIDYECQKCGAKL
ncbi:MAG: hypothetical protein WAV15_02830 [Minisyncoccia bacterium]